MSIDKTEELKSCFILVYKLSGFYFNYYLRFQASFCSQFFYLFWRQFKSTIREPFATRILFAQSVVLY
jgi:hypothetical protein